MGCVCGRSVGERRSFETIAIAESAIYMLRCLCMDIGHVLPSDTVARGAGQSCMRTEVARVAALELGRCGPTESAYDLWRVVQCYNMPFRWVVKVHAAKALGFFV